MSYIKEPMNIEKRSFEIIEEELGEKINNFSDEEKPIIKRVIHTTADFEYADLLEIKNDAVNSAIEALESGSRIYCDTKMIVNGLSKNVLDKFGVTAYSLVSDEDVIKEAKERGVTK